MPSIYEMFPTTFAWDLLGGMTYSDKEEPVIVGILELFSPIKQDPV